MNVACKAQLLHTLLQNKTKYTDKQLLDRLGLRTVNDLNIIKVPQAWFLIIDKISFFKFFLNEQTHWWKMWKRWKLWKSFYRLSVK